MENTKKSRKSKTPGSKKCGIKLDFISRLNRSESIFQARMTEIFRKYDRPFVNDIIIHFEDLTYETPEGRRPWNFETGISENGRSEDLVSEEHIGETEDSEETQLTFSKVEQFSSQTCTTLIQHEEDNPYADGHKGFVSTQNSELSVVSKTIYVALPLKAEVSGQVNRFIDMNSKGCFLQYPGRYNVSVCQANDSGSSGNEEASFSQPGNKTLAELYPQMIENLSKIWDFNFKNQAADNIIQYYRRHMWYKNKKVSGMKMVNKSLNKTYSICPAPNVEEITSAPEIYDSTLLQEECLQNSGIGESNKIHSPDIISQVHKLDSPTIPVSIRSPGNVNNTSKCIINNHTIYMDQQHKQRKCVMSPSYSSRASSSSTKSITSKSQMDIDIAQSPVCKDSKHLQQNIHKLSRRNSFSGFPMLQSPKKVTAKPNCNMTERTNSLSKAITTQNQMEVDERNHTSYKESISQLPNRTCTLTRRNSFSAFSVAHRDFESLYKNLTHARPQPDFSLCKPQVQLSKTVSSLVNSPGSLRAKRPLSHDFSFSMSKKPRSATEALMGSSKKTPHHSVDSNDLLCSEPSSSLTPFIQHSVVASSLPTHMLPSSPVSLRSFSPGSPTRRMHAYTGN